MGLGFFSLSHTPKPQSPGQRSPMCGRCGLNKTCKTPRMAPTGEGLRKILVVAEAPGRQEDEQGIQLIGEAGQKLRKHLRNVGVDLDRDCWKTNAVLCRPPNNRTPTDIEIEGCRPWLFKTIQQFQPYVILLMGGSAVESLIRPVYGDSVGAMETWCGWEIPCQNPRAWIVPTWHPSYLNRVQDPALDLLFEQHLSRAVALSASPPPILPDPEVRIELRPSVAARVVRKIARGERPIAFDYETLSLKPEVPGTRILSCSVSDGQRTIAYPWHGEAIEATVELLQGPLPKTGANIQFEERWSQIHAGGPVNNWWWDTMLGAHILDNRSGICGLKFQSFVRLGIPYYAHKVDGYKQPKANGLNRLNEVDIKDVLLYNGLDAANTWDLAQIQSRDVDGSVSGLNI